jgi:hypothetical protein
MIVNHRKKMSEGRAVGYFAGALAALALALVVFTTPGCVNTQVVDPTTGATNIVKTIDPEKLAQVQRVVEGVTSGVFRKAIANSPQHADEIASYVRAVGSAFCSVQASGKFSPQNIIDAVDAATAGLQSGVDDTIINGKNGLIALYQILWNDKLTVTVPGNKWPAAVVQTICGSIDRALKDSGRPGVQ